MGLNSFAVWFYICFHYFPDYFDESLANVNSIGYKINEYFPRNRIRLTSAEVHAKKGNGENGEPRNRNRLSVKQA